MIEDDFATHPMSTTYSVYVPDGEKKYLVDINRDIGKETTVLFLYFETKMVPIPSMDLEVLLDESRATPSQVMPRRVDGSTPNRKVVPKSGYNYVEDIHKKRYMRNRPLIPHLPDPYHYRCSSISYYEWDDYDSPYYYGYSERKVPIVHKFYTNTLIRWKMTVSVYDDIGDSVETELCREQCVPGRWYTIEMDDVTIQSEKMAIIRESTSEEIFEHDERW